MLTGAVDAEGPSDGDLVAEVLFIIFKLFMNKKEKVQYITVVDNS